MPAVTQPTNRQGKEQGRTTSTHTDTKTAQQQARTRQGKAAVDKAMNYITINTHKHTTIYHHLLTIIYQGSTDRRQTQHQGNNTPRQPKRSKDTILLYYFICGLFAL